jgi:hypothetical protein
MKQGEMTSPHNPNLIVPANVTKNVPGVGAVLVDVRERVIACHMRKLLFGSRPFVAEASE